MCVAGDELPSPLFKHPSCRKASALGSALPKLVVHFLSQRRLSQALLLGKVAVMLVHFLLLLDCELTCRIRARARDIRVVDLGLGAGVGRGAAAIAGGVGVCVGGWEVAAGGG